MVSAPGTQGQRTPRRRLEFRGAIPAPPPSSRAPVPTPAKHTYTHRHAHPGSTAPHQPATAASLSAQPSSLGTQPGGRAGRAASAPQDLPVSRVRSPSRARRTPPTAPSPAAGRRGRGGRESPLTLQREEGQEEAQHPDAVQPVGPHVSAALDAPWRAPALASSADALSSTTRRSLPSVFLRAFRLERPGQTRLLPHDGRTQSSFAVLRETARWGPGGTLGACAWCQHSEPPSPASSPALLPTLLSLTPLQLQLNATVLKQAASYRTANPAERAPLLPSSAHSPVSPQPGVDLRARSIVRRRVPFALRNTGELAESFTCPCYPVGPGYLVYTRKPLELTTQVSSFSYRPFPLSMKFPFFPNNSVEMLLQMSPWPLKSKGYLKPYTV